jgi:hypothetical protein
VTRVTHLPLDWVLLILYCVSVWATLYAAWMLAKRGFRTVRARWGAVTLLACWMTLPIAGTSLMLMDPYVTARSFSTPLTLLALCGMLDVLEGRGGWLLCAGSLAVAALLHPLMAGYGLASVAVLACVGAGTRRVQVAGSVALTGAALGLAAIVQRLGAAESGDYLRVVRSRYYWFPSQWEWYERVGLAAPLALLAAMLVWRNRAALERGSGALVRLGLTLGAIAVLVALGFSRLSLTTHGAARLQPLRCFQIVYVLMILHLGAAMGEYWMKGKAWRWVAFAALGAVPMYAAARATYPASEHFEAPWRTSPNGWVEAFRWARANTPVDALFAMDAHYITGDGEDAQSFRAIAERSALPDYSKDGGEASITPWLTPAWALGQKAQAGIDTESDAARVQALAPLGVDWVVLRSEDKTGLRCPYRNDVAMVCRLR